MSADAIIQVTRAMSTRLQRALVASGDPGSVFVGPLDDPDSHGASLILFLYRVVPSPSLRNREHRVPSSDPASPVLVFQNSLPLDLYYLVTVGTRPGMSEEVLLRTLGFAVRELHLDPDLVGQEVGHETVHTSLESLTTEEASRIWTLFPTANYRTSVAYLATPVWIDPPAPQPPASRVLQDALAGGAKIAGASDHG